jgi:alpha-glucosidase
MKILFMLAPLVGAAVLGSSSQLDDCPGYKAYNVKQLGETLTADLKLAGEPCDTYGSDLPNLKLLVEAQTGMLTCQINYPVDIC